MITEAEIAVSFMTYCLARTANFTRSVHLRIALSVWEEREVGCEGTAYTSQGLCVRSYFFPFSFWALKHSLSKL